MGKEKFLLIHELLNTHMLSLSSLMNGTLFYRGQNLAHHTIGEI